MTRSLVLHPAQKGDVAAAARLAEGMGLAAAIDVEIVGGAVAYLARRNPATLFGPGKVDEIAAQVAAEEIDLVVVNGTLSPVQQRNLERAWKTKVLDRTGLILEIFGARARTREGVLQVELAHLDYQKSRLVRSWTHLERQRGGAGFMGGPGETQIEADRRAIDEKMVRLRRRLEKVVKTRALHRAARRKVPHPVVALVGYTNAGKSTLFNRLTDAGVMAEDMLFATLDPTMRQIVLPSGRTAILSDTVGFISDLPTQLVAAFRATLEEVLEADTIVHVRDIAHPETERQRSDVAAVLDELGIGEARRDGMIEALNKIDLLDDPEPAVNRAAREERTVAVSALDGRGADALLAAIENALFPARHTIRFDLPHGAGRAVAWLYDHAAVEARDDTETGIALTVEITERVYFQFIKIFGDVVRGAPALPQAAQ